MGTTVECPKCNGYVNMRTLTCDCDRGAVSVSPDRVMDDWYAGLCPRDPHDDLGVLTKELNRLRAEAHKANVRHSREVGALLAEIERLRDDTSVSPDPQR